jgi:hypothetical protein
MPIVSKLDEIGVKHHTTTPYGLGIPQLPIGTHLRPNAACFVFGVFEVLGPNPVVETQQCHFKDVPI